MKRQKGTHTQWFRESDRRYVTVPKMKRVLSVGTVAGIERSTGIDLRNRGIKPREATDHTSRPAP
ncbi:MAG: hypothetical protein KI792_00660 [Alphaproteobacteria bacterium]|nr:hypothetical protein [Alphaproteobacteria bacterium SS10]